MLENYFIYILLCVLLIILPGPDTAIVNKNTLVRSKKDGYLTMFGTLTALMIHTSFAVVGLSAIIVKSAKLFMILKLIGAVYLIYLGFKTLIAMTRRKTPVALEGKSKNDHSSYLQGFLTNLLNPKVAVFFLTFLPQFVSEQGNPLIAFFLLGVTYSMLTFFWFVFYISLLNVVRAFMNKPLTQKIMEGMTGTVLILFGFQLAFSK